MFHIKEIKYVTPKNTQIHIIIATYDKTDENEIRTPEIDLITTNTKGHKEMRIEIAMNGHLERCICEKCHQARELLKLMRNM